MRLPRQSVDGAAPAAPLYNLIRSATIPDASDDGRWTAQTIWPYPCGPASSWNPCVVDGPKDIVENPELVDVDAFVVYLALHCNTLSGPVEEIERRARIAFAAYEVAEAERQFWQGAAIPTNPHLNQVGSTDVTPTPGTPIDDIEALALLELAIAAGKTRGMIHATVDVVTLWTAHNLVAPSRDGKTLQTTLGTIVVPGVGYNGSAPGGALPDDGERWAYATGIVTLQRGPVEVYPDTVAGAVAYATNDATYYVERPYLIQWDGCIHAGVLIAV